MAVPRASDGARGTWEQRAAPEEEAYRGPGGVTEALTCRGLPEARLHPRAPQPHTLVLVRWAEVSVVQNGTLWG